MKEKTKAAKPATKKADKPKANKPKAAKATPSDGSQAWERGEGVACAADQSK